jgi:hypothetical protein
MIVIKITIIKLDKMMIIECVVVYHRLLFIHPIKHQAFFAKTIDGRIFIKSPGKA